ncbi:phosphotyrosyl phosphatase activator, putative [Trichomonas vaginalis G3]|uniref:Serine/threonine-protein phosphatase 2A activator n=1 Tax=Trichomonas vaginalis (strain ATCC PRA-98 / G3) TaxID=412133 RepID=A2ENV5_TRIV3|nr:phosphatase activator protein [Trichomonas vaginalis G3]EAY05645.1 phosphotyrosyl phosphatase activator, putative [Trichomonas vaginalis G3]KAI5553885.1 phosphatase activator protein [Trichomonas vaginalis G3]|eukprot:XP_001317868.1 phosphotyrosyl phosphatase activator [Trichomonas vaginalis G3]
MATGFPGRGGRVEIQDSNDVLSLCQMKKMICNDHDIEPWTMSPAYAQICNVLQQLAEAVKSKPRSHQHVVNPIIGKILDTFKILHQYLIEIEPLKTPMRFGNRAYRTWLTKVYDNRKEILKEISDNPDVWDYYCQSFGSWTRIDYGTGHEFNFLAFIASLFALGIVQPEDSEAIVFDVFWAYWDLVVAVQERYHQEPAGSHGSWGLDDYVFLPFLFGASQLIDHPEITPANVIDPVIAKAYVADYSYCKWIDYIYKVKKGAFAEHSRMLYSLRNVPHFTKLTGGMFKMYKGEVMDRFLVVQHFRFGEVLKWE